MLGKVFQLIPLGLLCAGAAHGENSETGALMRQLRGAQGLARSGPPEVLAAGGAQWSDGSVSAPAVPVSAAALAADSPDTRLQPPAPETGPHGAKAGFVRGFTLIESPAIDLLVASGESTRQSVGEFAYGIPGTLLLILLAPFALIAGAGAALIGFF